MMTQRRSFLKYLLMAVGGVVAQKLNIANIEKIRAKDPFLAEALESIARPVENIAQQTTASLVGSTPKPSPPVAINVVASGGIHDIAITDSDPTTQRGINYFAEYSSSASFAQATTVDLGAARNIRLGLGNQTFFWRARRGYPTGPSSDPVYFGTEGQPTAVTGGGSATGPAPQASQGAGTSQGANGGDGGFGNNPIRGAGSNQPQIL